MGDVLILGLETSCDETAAAVIRDGRVVLSNIISSQTDLHQKYGGVVPELASRRHLENVLPVVDAALETAGVALGDVHGIGVTYGPGLVGALLVGIATAKALAYARNIPLLGVNHIEAHIYANFLEHSFLETPFIALVVSGGHTALVHVPAHGQFRLLGHTRDDAAGEAFDKIARVLGLGYPGGPEIERLAQTGNPRAIDFPRAFFRDDSYEFSFSGLKSAVINYWHNARQRKETVPVADIAASFQQAVVDVLTAKAVAAARMLGAKHIVLAGGVAANRMLRACLASEAGTYGIEVVYPRPGLCTDNAAMVACRAYYQYCRREYASLDLNAVPGLAIGNIT